MSVRFLAALVIASTAATSAPALAADSLHETHVRVERPGSKGLPPVYRMVKKDAAAQEAHFVPAGKIKAAVAKSDAKAANEAVADAD